MSDRKNDVEEGGGTCSWVEEGLEHCRKGEYVKALECCEKAIEQEPESAEAWLCRCNALKGLNRESEALECYERALHLDPRIVQAWVSRGNILFRMGRTDEAMESMDRARKLKRR